jgi:hypothetical protein
MKAINNARGDTNVKVLRMTVFFFIAFGAAGFYYLIVNMQSFIAHNPNKLELYYKQAKRFNPEQKTEFLKSHAGFWVYQSYFLAGGVPLKKIDLLELKDNGIIWEVIEWDVKMPSGKESGYYQIRTGYVEPYGLFKNDTLGDAYTIHQSFITASDTCFGGWNFLDLWVIRKEGESLVICKRKYDPYKGVIRDFFPYGMIDLVGLGGSKENNFIKKTGTGAVGVQIELKTSVPGVKRVDSGSMHTNALILPDCLEMNSLNDVVKKELFHEYSCRLSKAFSLDSAVLYLDRYYQPLFFYERFRLFPRPIPSAVGISFSIKVDGTIDTIQIVSPKSIDKMFHDDLIREMRTWHFPQPDDVIRVTHTFTMP